MTSESNGLSPETVAIGVSICVGILIVYTTPYAAETDYVGYATFGLIFLLVLLTLPLSYLARDYDLF